MSKPVTTDAVQEVAPSVLHGVAGGAMFRWPVSRAMAFGQAERHQYLHDFYHAAAEKEYERGSFRAFGEYMSRVGIHAKEAGEWLRSGQASWWRRNFGTVE